MAKSTEVPASYRADWIEALDGRTRLARAVHERLATLYSDLGGGADGGGLSYQQRSLCRRVVWLEVLIETRESALARGQAIDEGAHTQSVNALSGLLSKLGLARRAREAPSLDDYLREQRIGGEPSSDTPARKREATT